MDALLQFEEQLTNASQVLGALQVETSGETFSAGSVNAPVLHAFEEAAYEHGFVISDFDWSNWAEGRELVQHPERITTVPLETIRRLITAHVRAERFSGGHLASMCANGHIAAVRRRLRELRDGS